MHDRGRSGLAVEHPTGRTQRHASVLSGALSIALLSAIKSHVYDFEVRPNDAWPVLISSFMACTYIPQRRSSRAISDLARTA